MAFINPAEAIPTKTSKGEEWKAWYLELKNRYGKKNANTIFTKAWSKRGSDSAITNDLDETLKKNGVNIQRGLVASIQEGAYDIADTIGDVFSMGKYVWIGGLVMVGVPVFIFLLQIARKPERVGAVAGTAIKYAK
jgi:hypothetical protein